MRFAQVAVLVSQVSWSTVAAAQAAAPTSSGAPAPPPTVATPPPPVAPAPRLPSQWRMGDPVPPGYHVEQVPRAGLVTAGYIVTGIPYFFSVVTALAGNERNESGWLLLPFAGPWMTLGQRSYGCNPDQSNQTTSQSLTCVGDVFAVMGLIFDGVVQAAGGALLLSGYVATKPGLVINDDGMLLTPMRIGSGMGAGVVGGF